MSIDRKISDEEFLDLVVRYHDDALSDAENEQLNELLKSSPEHVKLFNDFSLQVTKIVNYAALEVGYDAEPI